MKLSISMTRRETLLGWGYLLFSMFLFPVLFNLVNSRLQKPLSDAQQNLIYFFLNFSCISVIFHRFLWQSLKAALGAPWRCLRFAGLGLLLYYVGMVLVSQLILQISPDFSNVNDDSIAAMTKEHSNLMAFSTIWLVPITEETLYRGLFFQGLQRKSRFLAYLVSMLIFSAIHVLGYIGWTDWLTLLLCFIQYFPAGITLAFAYEKADTILAPMLMHITINQIAMSAMR